MLSGPDAKPQRMRPRRRRPPMRVRRCAPTAWSSARPRMPSRRTSPRSRHRHPLQLSRRARTPSRCAGRSAAEAARAPCRWRQHRPAAPQHEAGRRRARNLRSRSRATCAAGRCRCACASAGSGGRSWAASRRATMPSGLARSCARGLSMRTFRPIRAGRQGTVSRSCGSGRRSRRRRGAAGAPCGCRSQVITGGALTLVAQV